MIPLEISLLIAGICSFFFTAFILLTLKLNPRIWLHDYPKEIQKEVSPKNQKEEKLTIVLGLAFLLIFAGSPLVLTCIYLINNNQTISFFYFILHFLIIFHCINLIDLLVLDWLLFCFLTPGFMIIPGTVGNTGYKNYKFHFIAFLKGILISSVASVIIALICYLLDLYIIN